MLRLPVVPVAIPVLETERLLLDAPRLSDFEESLSMWSDPEVVRFIGGRASTREEVWARLVRYIGHWAALGWGYWAVREKATGRWVGEIGFGEMQRDVTPAFDGAPEIGWALAAWAHGRGYASEAVGAAVAWGDTAFSGARTVCLISPENTASIRVAEKAGYRPWTAGRYRDAPTLLFER